MTRPKTKSQLNATGFILTGNSKIPASTAILNLAPAELCSSRALGLCQLKNPEKECYSLRESRTYGCRVCMPNRLSAMEYFSRNSAWQIAQDLIKLNESKRSKITALRISESGDFFTKADVDKCENIASYLAQAGIKTYAYSARADLDFSDCRHLVINASGWGLPGMNRFQVAYNLAGSDELGWTCEDKNGATVKLDALCPGDCRICSRCLVQTGKVTGVKIH